MVLIFSQEQIKRATRDPDEGQGPETIASSFTSPSSASLSRGSYFQMTFIRFQE